MTKGLSSQLVQCFIFNCSGIFLPVITSILKTEVEFFNILICNVSLICCSVGCSLFVCSLIKLNLLTCDYFFFQFYVYTYIPTLFFFIFLLQSFSFFVLFLQQKCKSEYFYVVLIFCFYFYSVFDGCKYLFVLSRLFMMP